MLELDPEGFQKRHPSAKKVIRTQLTSSGPDDEWCGDGHDKLNKIGIGIYGVRDKFSGYWLGLWAVPCNWYKDVIAYLYLSLVEEKKGVPLILTLVALLLFQFFALGVPNQTTTDCGSETTGMYGLANALQ